MKKIKVEPLSLEAFKEFGTYTDLLNPTGLGLGELPAVFFPDRLIQDFDVTGRVAYSGQVVDPRPLIVSTTENHYTTGEGMLPLDGDAIMYFGPASKVPDFSRFRAFLVPKGTMVVMRPGVWHYSPYAAGDKRVHLMVALPEMTYAKDCCVVPMEGDAQIELVK